MTLEGQQTIIIDVDGRMFQIFLYDTAGKGFFMEFRTGRNAPHET
jgi:hypothetical protein